MYERKIKIIFIIINILILIWAYFFIKNKSFIAIDSFVISNLSKSFKDTTKPKWYSNIALIKIDNKFFKNEWVTISTFHRWYYAKLLEKLKQYWVKNIVFDVYFWKLKYWKWKNKAQIIYQKASKYFDNKFEKQLWKNIVLWAIPQNNYVELPDENFIKKWVFLGYVKSHINKKEINDWVYPYWIDKEWRKIITLWFAAYINKLFLERKIKKINYKIQKSKNLIKPDYFVINTNKWDIKIPLSKDTNWENFIFTPLFVVNSITRQYSLYDILHDEDNIYKEKLEWKTVFVWSTDETLNDVKVSYAWIIPWVLFHINNFLSISSKNFFYELPVNASFLIILATFFISYIFVIFFKNEKLTFAIFFVTLFALFISYYILFLQWVIIPFWTFIVILTIKLIIDIIHILFINQEKRKFLSNLFDKYVGSQVREEKEEKKNFVISTKNKNISLMFSDIASFTNISENLEPEQVGKMLNIYFEVIGKFIRESNGYVDKYIWDAIMAYWENIESNDKILESVIKIQRSHSYIKNKIKSQLNKDIDIKTRIWLHYGTAIVWDIWDKNWKIQATAIWDNVNLASRLEWINKYYGTFIILSEDFYKKIKNKNYFLIRKIDIITVKWKTKPVTIYEAQNLLWKEIKSDILDYINDFEKALELYFKWDFKNALNSFKKLEIFKFGGLDNVLKIYIQRLNFLIKNPPKDWDGVWKYKTK